MEKVNALEYDSKPDYQSFRDLLRGAGKKAGLRDEWKLELGTSVVMSQAKVGGAAQGEQTGLGLPGEREEGEQGESPSMFSQQLEERSSDLCLIEGSNTGSLVVVGHELGWLEELLARLLHQLSSDVLNQPQLQLSEVFGSLVLMLATVYLIYLLSSPYFISPSTLDEKFQIWKEETM